MSAAAPFLGDLKRGKDEIPQISWPSDYVVSQTGGFLGYRMPKMNSDEFISLERVLQKECGVMKIFQNLSAIGLI